MGGRLMAGALRFTTGVELVLDGETYEAGDYEVENAPPELRASVANAAAAVPEHVEVHAGGDDSGVQSQEEGEAALAEAMGEWVDPVVDEEGNEVEPGRWSGPWQEGQVADTEARLALEAEARERGELVDIAPEDVGDAAEVLGGEDS